MPTYKSYVVIGANFGDEGKGHITNFLCDENTLNIKFNGGAQAAHAVFLSDGRSHIFHQFGAGSLRGARTLLASHFIVNPIIFVEEYLALSKKAKLREVFIDPRCRVSTHYDMLINEFSCQHRGKNDTAGMGINETVERSLYRQLRLSMRDLIDKSEADLKKILLAIWNEYVPWRIEKLSLPLDAFKPYCAKRNFDCRKFDEAYVRTIKGLLKCSVVWPDSSLIDKFLAKGNDRNLVFEGGQGMLLDQRRKEFMPYLTRSSTGLQNVFDCLRMVRTPLDLDVYLVTRSYLTRHGDGPIFNETGLPFLNEPTNPENQYQGKMRYGFLDKSWYDKAIEEIGRYATKHMPSCASNINVGVAMTCLDQVDGFIPYSLNGSNSLIQGQVEHFQKVKLISKGVTEDQIEVL